MRNLLRLETKGCPRVDELEGERISVGKGEGGKIAYVSYLIGGVVEERLWGIPRGITE
jgi:hypothetical protein